MREGLPLLCGLLISHLVATPPPHPPPRGIKKKNKEKNSRIVCFLEAEREREREREREIISKCNIITGDSSNIPSGKLLPPWCCQAGHIFSLPPHPVSQRLGKRGLRRRCLVESGIGPLRVEDCLVWGQESQSERSLARAASGSKG